MSVSLHLRHLCLLLPLGFVLGLGPAWPDNRAHAASFDSMDSNGFSEQRCTSCHEIYADFSHPVGMEPSMAVPPEMPLEFGRVTCSTCHKQGHFQTVSSSGEPGYNLRGVGRPGLVFCAQCHQDSRASTRAMHVEPTRRAHLLWPGRRRAMEIDFRRDGGGMASDGARTCLGCHDGSIAINAGSSSLGGGIESGGHPVDVFYGSHRSRVARHLNPAGMLDPRIRLQGGRVGCESCHSPFSKRDNLLVMSNIGSKLCLNCHAF